MNEKDEAERWAVEKKKEHEWWVFGFCSSLILQHNETQTHYHPLGHLVALHEPQSGSVWFSALDIDTKSAGPSSLSRSMCKFCIFLNLCQFLHLNTGMAMVCTCSLGNIEIGVSGKLSKLEVVLFYKEIYCFELCAPQGGLLAMEKKSVVRSKVFPFSC